MIRIPIDGRHPWDEGETEWLEEHVGQRNSDWWIESASGSGGLRGDIVLVLENDEHALEYLMRWS